MSSALKRLIPLAALLAPLLTLAGCGFHPLYGPQSGQSVTVAGQLDQIDIGLIADRQGQVLRQALESTLQHDGNPGFYRYHLTVSYGLSQQIIGVQPDSSFTRSRVFGTANWVLTAEGNQTLPLTKGAASAMDASDIIDNQNFAQNLDAGYIRHHLARQLADQITTELAIYFRAHPDHG